MANLSDLFPGGGGGGAVPRAVLSFSTSQVFTVPYDMTVIAHAIGGGGGGALVGGTSGYATGGQAGTHVMSSAAVALTAGQAVTITIGAGGVQLNRFANTATVRQNGNAGGDTSLVGSGLNMVAAGGSGGVATDGNSHAICPDNSGASSGGIILPGGVGGPITSPVHGSMLQASGGGAVNFGAGGFSGGAINYAGSPSASSGAGLGETGGHHPTWSSNSGGGAGLFWPATVQVQTSEITLPLPIFGMIDRLGPVSATGINPGVGFGGSSHTSGYGAYMNGGGFAGGGGAVHSTGQPRAGYGGYGGGGGGCAGSSYSQAQYCSAGGNGLVVLEIVG